MDGEPAERGGVGEGGARWGRGAAGAGPRSLAGSSVAKGWPGAKRTSRSRISVGKDRGPESGKLPRHRDWPTQRRRLLPGWSKSGRLRGAERERLGVDSEPLQGIPLRGL